MEDNSLSQFGAKVMEVIVTTLDVRGRGVDGDPIRRLTQFWTLDGELLGEVDLCAGKS